MNDKDVETLLENDELKCTMKCDKNAKDPETSEARAPRIPPQGSKTYLLINDCVRSSTLVLILISQINDGLFSFIVIETSVDAAR